MLEEIKVFCKKYNVRSFKNELVFYTSVLLNFMKCFPDDTFINLKAKGAVCYVPLSQILKKPEIEELKTFLDSL